MKKLYFILPFVGLLAFTGVYHRHEVAARATAEKLAHHKAEVSAQAESTRQAEGSASRIVPSSPRVKTG